MIKFAPESIVLDQPTGDRWTSPASDRIPTIFHRTETRTVPCQLEIAGRFLDVQVPESLLARERSGIHGGKVLLHVPVCHRLPVLVDRVVAVPPDAVAEEWITAMEDFDRF